MLLFPRRFLYSLMTMLKFIQKHVLIFGYFFYLQLDSTVTQLAIAGNFIGRSGIKVITDMLKENETITNVVS